MVATVAFDRTEKMTGKRWAGLLGEVDGPAGPLWLGYLFFSEIPEFSQFSKGKKRRKERGEIRGKIN